MTKFIEVERRLINADFIEQVTIEPLLMTVNSEIKEHVIFRLKDGENIITPDLNKYTEFKNLISLS